jgi:hypothetical protein
MVDDTILQKVYDSWKEKGFPYYSTDDAWRNERYEQLINYKRDVLVDRRTKVIGQTQHGQSLAWSFMEHAWGIKCGKMLTPMDIWNDEKALKKGLAKILDGVFFPKTLPHRITDSLMRLMLRRITGTQMVSNFRPTAAAALYDIFVDKKSPLEGTESGTVWDPSMGYGGRLLGAIAAGVNYIGTDPCIPTFKGLEQILERYGNLGNEYSIHRQGSETYIPEDESLDFVFTSPPYFGWEAYGDEPEQSSIKFDTSEVWKEKFLKQTIANAYKGLKTGKYLALNVANTKQYKTFEEDTVTLSKSVGFTHTDTWWLSLSTQQGKPVVMNLDGELTEPKQKQRYMGEYTRPDIPNRKFEPVFIFKK